MTRTTPLFLSLSLLTLGLSAPAVLAAGATAAAHTAAPAVGAQPSRTSEVFGDWTLSCVAVPGKGTLAKLCEAGVVMTARGSTRPVAKFALSRGAKTGSYTVGALLPVNVALPSTVRLATAAGKTVAQLDWARCLPGACLAEKQATTAEVRAWEKEVKPLRLTFVTAARKAITIPVSVHGMTAAMNALDGK